MTARSISLLSVLLTVVACSDDASGPDAGGNNNTDGRLQVVSAVSAVSAVDVVVDGQTRLSNVPYGVPSSPIALSMRNASISAITSAA